MRTRQLAFVILDVATLLAGLYLRADAAGAGYTLSTEDTSLRVEVRASRIGLVALKSPKSSWDWIAAADSQGTETEPFLPLPLLETAESNKGVLPLQWRFVGSRILEGLPRRLVVTFVSLNPALELQSVWTARSGPGPVEHRLTITNKDKFPVLLPLQPSLAFDSRLPEGHKLEHWWVEKGANTPTDDGTRHSLLKPDYAAALVSLPYAAEDAKNRDPIPWTAIQDVEGRQGWYLGIESSARVRIALQCSVAPSETNGAVSPRPILHTELGLDPDEKAAFPFRTRLSPGETFEAPPVFLGCYQGDVDDGANRLHRWVEANLRPPVHDPRLPLLVNNTWGSGMKVDAKLAHKMIDDSAELGLEMFHLDAGWFRGVGDWYPDPQKFPLGLASLADYAHGKGLKFGLWVGWTQGGDRRDETGKRAILSVFDPAMKPWFTHDYKPTWKPAEFTGADVCLGDPRAVDWCVNQLRRVIRENKLDMLEHDQRIIVDACDRSDHLHTTSASDIAYRAAQGYNHIYDTLRGENLTLLFEDCVNGGHTVDYSIVQRTHYISITDTYDPLSNRRAFYDASYALPPAMCECYVANEPTQNLPEFLAMLRSGMMGWCTVMCDTSQWTKAQRAAAKRQFDLYKTRLRPLIAGADLYHVTERPDGIRWDGIQYYDPKVGKGVLYAFRGTTRSDSFLFQLKGLDPDARYEITFEDKTNPSTTYTGAELMQTGLPLQLPLPKSSELVFLTRQ